MRLINVTGRPAQDPPTAGCPGQSYAELRGRGIAAIRAYSEVMDFDTFELLGQEYGFMVPIQGTWDYDLDEPHYLAGSVVRLGVRHCFAVS